MYCLIGSFVSVWDDLGNKAHEQLKLLVDESTGRYTMKDFFCLNVALLHHLASVNLAKFARISFAWRCGLLLKGRNLCTL